MNRAERLLMPIKKWREGAFITHVAPFFLLVLLAGFMTWPLANPSPDAIPASDDVYFSIWRLAWVAHQLPADPAHLFDANIFAPARDTLAYSDAMLLIGVLAAPFFEWGFQPALIHNGALLVAFIASAFGAYLLAYRLTGDRTAAMLAGVVFGFCPYRFAHIGHLELQWALWMPLGLLFLHRLFDRPSAFNALMLGLMLTAQALSSIYYGVFLAVYLFVAWLILMAWSGHRLRVLRLSAIAVVPILLVLAIYGPPYARARESFGARSATEIADFSAQPGDYLRVPPENRLRGDHAATGVAPDERSLFPGAVALIFAAMALWPPLSRSSRLYAVLALVSLDASLGSHGVLFPLIQKAAPVVTSLRSPARFSLLVTLSVALLAAFAAARLRQAHRWGSAVVVLAIILSLVEDYSAPLTMRGYDIAPSTAHAFLRTLPPGSIVLELPVPPLDSLWFHEALYQARSIDHWQPLVNGYSGFAPDTYRRTLAALSTFPDTPSFNRLAELGVDVIVVNREFYEEAAYQSLIERLRESDRVEQLRSFDRGPAEVAVMLFRK